MTPLENKQSPSKYKNDVFNQHAECYSESIDQTLQSYGVRHDFFTSHKALLIQNLLEKKALNSSKMDLVDIGCGIGNIHKILAPKFHTITGVDVSAASIQVAKMQSPHLKYHCYDGNRLPLSSASADMSIAICVLHHVPPVQWYEFTNEMMRILRPGGIALVIEHNPFNPVTRRIVKNCPLDKDAVLISQSKTRELFEAAGATSIYSRTVLSIPPVNSLAMNIDQVLGYLPFGAQHICLSVKPTT